MRKVLKEIEIYNFNELSQKVQEEVFQNTIDVILDTDFKGFLEETAKKLLQENFKNNATFKNIYYNFNYCQR